MKRKIFIIIFAYFIFYNNVYTQFKKGDFEMSFAGNIGSTKIIFEYQGDDKMKTGSETYYYADIFLETSYFIIDNVSLQIDFGISIMNSSINPDIILILNAVYNYRIKNSIVAVFGKLGYGISNSIISFEYNPSYATYTGSYGGGEKVNILNSSLGTMIILSDVFAVIAEINYKNFSIGKRGYDWSLLGKKKLSLLLGMSFFF